MTIGLFGRSNVGKSSVLNALTDQKTSIVSPCAGTTTDPVEKAMELPPLGPVLFIDTAGLDDEGLLGSQRTERTVQTFDRCDIAIIVSVAGQWGSFENDLFDRFQDSHIPCIIVFTMMDTFSGDVDACRARIPQRLRSTSAVCMIAPQQVGVNDLLQAILDTAPEHFLDTPALVSDIIPEDSTVVLVIPLDKQAPKGRLILPQVQVMRDLLDAGHCVMAVRDSELPAALENLAMPPALVITDSQVFDSVAKIVPDSIPLTGFSTIMARSKGDLAIQTQGTLRIDTLTEQSRILIAEACTHHPIKDDIGTVKLPALLRKRIGSKLQIDHVRGNDFPDNLEGYDLIILCGSCTFNRRAVLSRINRCLAAGVPVSNYGLMLAHLNNILYRSVKAFPEVEALSTKEIHAKSSR